MSTPITTVDQPTIEQMMPTIEKILDLYGEERTSFFWARNGRVLHVKESKAKGKGAKYLTRGHIYRHLMGDYAVCVLGSPDGSAFTCFDVDSGGWAMASRVMEALRDMGVPADRIYASTSGGKGYHIEMFYDRKVPYMDQRLVYRKMLASIGASAHEVEFRPTHTQAIKLPLSKHHKTGNWCWYLNTETGQPYEGSEYVFKIERMPADQIVEIARVIEAEDRARSGNICDSTVTMNDIVDATASAEGERRAVEYELVDLINLPRITAPGERHHLVMCIAMAYRAEGMDRWTAMELLRAWYGAQDKNLTLTPEHEAIDDIESVVNWVFSKYKPSTWEDGERRKAKFTASRVEQILSVTGLTARAMLFQTYVWTACSDCNRSTEEEMARIYGVSQYSIHSTKKSLVEKNILQFKAGKTVRRDGRYMSARSTLHEGVLRKKTKIPNESKRADYAEVDPVRMQRDFWLTYFEAMFTVADRDWLITKLGKREMDKLAEIEQKG